MQGQKYQLAAHRLYPNNQREAISTPSSSEVHKRKLITLPSSLCKPSLRAYFNWDDNGNDDYAKRPALLDLFAGGGGAAMGYYLAGFRVVGIDIANQKHYPFEFHQADAMTYPLDGFDVIHASPPCQAYSQMRFLSKARNGGNYPSHPDLIAAVRNILECCGKPFIIENVPQSPIRKDITLCGSMFGLKVYRHRHFESNVRLVQPEHVPHRDKSPGAGNGLSPKGFITATKQGGIRGMKEPQIVAYISNAMGIDWADRRGMGEAIPPAYTEFIGKQLMEYLRSGNEAL